MAVHSVQDCSHCTKQKMTRAPSLETRVAAESIESYALKRLQYLALNLLIPRALFGFGRFFRRMRGRLRTSCCRRMRSRLRTGRGFSAGCSLLARRRLRVSCSRFGLRWTSLLGLRCSVLGRLILVRASCRCLILGCLVLVRASCRRLILGCLVLVRASRRCLILGCLVLVRASCGCLILGRLVLVRASCRCLVAGRLVLV